MERTYLPLAIEDDQLGTEFVDPFAPSGLEPLMAMQRNPQKTCCR